MLVFWSCVRSEIDKSASSVRSVLFLSHGSLILEFILAHAHVRSFFPERLWIITLVLHLRFLR